MIDVGTYLQNVTGPAQTAVLHCRAYACLRALAGEAGKHGSAKSTDYYIGHIVTLLITKI